jgi:hypothetical protein
MKSGTQAIGTTPAVCPGCAARMQVDGMCTSTALAVAHLCNLCPCQCTFKLLVQVSCRLVNTVAPVPRGHGQGQRRT